MVMPGGCLVVIKFITCSPLAITHFPIFFCWMGCPVVIGRVRGSILGWCRAVVCYGRRPRGRPIVSFLLGHLYVMALSRMVGVDGGGRAPLVDYLLRFGLRRRRRSRRRRRCRRKQRQLFSCCGCKISIYRQGHCFIMATKHKTICPYLFGRGAQAYLTMMVVIQFSQTGKG